MSDENDQSKLTRRRFLEAGSALMVAAAGMQAQGQQNKIYPTDPHTGVNESQPGPKNNTVLDGQNEDSAWQSPLRLYHCNDGSNLCSAAASRTIAAGPLLALRIACSK